LESKYDKSKAFTTIDFLGMSIFENDAGTFHSVFTNEFVYSIEASFVFCDPEEIIKDGMEVYCNSSEEEKGGQTETEFREYLRNLASEKNAHATLCRQQLRDIVQSNLIPGEAIEIYSAWVDKRNVFDFGPPTEVRVIDVEQISTSELLDLQESVKLIVRL